MCRHQGEKNVPADVYFILIKLIAWFWYLGYTGCTSACLSVFSVLWKFLLCRNFRWGVRICSISVFAAHFVFCVLSMHYVYCIFLSFLIHCTKQKQTFKQQSAQRREENDGKTLNLDEMSINAGLFPVLVDLASCWCLITHLWTRSTWAARKSSCSRLAGFSLR